MRNVLSKMIEHWDEKESLQELVQREKEKLKKEDKDIQNKKKVVTLNS